MKKYRLKAEVRRTVVDVIDLDVLAKDKDEAQELANKALYDFPDPIDAELSDNIPYIYIETRDSEIVDVLSVKSRDKEGTVNGYY